MDVERTPLEGVVLIKPQIWGDERGYFVETWQQERYAREAGITNMFSSRRIEIAGRLSCILTGT